MYYGEKHNEEKRMSRCPYAEALHRHLPLLEHTE